MKEPSESERGLTEHPSRRLGQKVMDFYFRPKRIERWKNGKLYEILGIKIVKKVCVYIGDAFGWDNYFIGGDRSAEGLRAYEKRTRINEAIHSPFTMLFVYQMISYLVEGRYVGAAILGVLAAPNGLPTALQRYNRVKIESVLHRMTSRKTRSSPQSALSQCG